MRGKCFSMMLVVAVAVFFTGCGKKANETCIELKKDGSVASQIVESFDKDYYDKDELQQMILAEAASYNRDAGDSAISIEKVEVEDDTAKVKMTYQSTADFAAFNENVFFVGKPSEAVKEGYNLNTVLSSVSDEHQTVGISDILAMTDVFVLVTDVKEPILLNGKAKYISGNVMADKSFKNISFDDTSEDLAYIIYK